MGGGTDRVNPLPLGGCGKKTHLFCFVFVREMWSRPKNNGLNPMSFFFCFWKGITLSPRRDPQLPRPGRPCVIINTAPKLRVDFWPQLPTGTHMQFGKCTEKHKFVGHEPWEARKTKFESCFMFFVREMRPISKNSGISPMSFVLVFGGGYLGTSTDLRPPPPWANPSYVSGCSRSISFLLNSF